MITDATLFEAITSDPFHQAMANATDLPFETICDTIEQLFPNSDTSPSDIWNLSSPQTSATFRPTSLRPARVR